VSDTDAAAGAPESPVAVVVMGVAGAGKSTLAVAIAERLDAAFIEADDLHSAEAKAQMAAGVPARCSNVASCEASIDAGMKCPVRSTRDLRVCRRRDDISAISWAVSEYGAQPARVALRGNRG